MGRRKAGEPMKEDTHMRLDPDLLAAVRAEVPANARTVTAAVEAGLRLWLKAIRRKPKA